jgi:hypothetical protein
MIILSRHGVTFLFRRRSQHFSSSINCKLPKLGLLLDSWSLSRAGGWRRLGEKD